MTMNHYTALIKPNLGHKVHNKTIFKYQMISFIIKNNLVGVNLVKLGYFIHNLLLFMLNQWSYSLNTILNLLESKTV